ncbi:MAG: VCBS repeat-containing protein [Saprospiraceae bacterium]|nr:VCBS repeat-containing protein [Saprospiraceae bacterium]
MRLPTKLYPIIFLLILVAACGKNESPDQTSTNTTAEPEIFELLPSDQTGVDFINRINESENFNYFSANYLYIGGGVGTADFNQDSLLDLYFVAVTGENQLYLNKGNLQFENVTEKAGVALGAGTKTGVAVVDINNDGWPDIYQCRTGDTPLGRDNVLYINQKDGTFKNMAAEYGLDLNSPSTEANFFDYDMDGDLDVYIINRPADFMTNSQTFVENIDGKPVRKNDPKTPEETDRLYQNNGDGTFTDVSQKAGINNRAFSLSVNFIDANEDNLPDIYVANDYVEPDHLYINQGDGTFKDEWQRYFRHMAHFSMGTDVADINNDGLMDIVTLDMLADDNYRQKRNGTVMKLDRYSTLVKLGFGHQIMRNMMFLNNGAGGFKEVAPMAGIHATDWSWTPLLADFDNDGWKDIYITNGMKRDVNDLEFTDYILDSLKASGADLNNFKLVSSFMPSVKIPNKMFKNTGGIATEDVTNAWGFHEKSFSNGAVYADLDNDGDLDIVVHNTDDKAFIYKNNAREKLANNYLNVRLNGAAGNLAGIGAKVILENKDLTQVQEKQLTRGFLSSSDQSLHFGLGKENSIQKLTVVWPNGAFQELTNVKANQTITVNAADASGKYAPKQPQGAYFTYQNNNLGINYTHVENAFEDFDRERLLHRRYSQMGPCIAAGDLNGDGLEDLYLGASFSTTAEIYFQTANGQFQKAPQPVFDADVIHENMDAVIFDINGDGANDIFVSNGGNEAPYGKGFYQNRLYINNGSGQFQAVNTALNGIDEASGAAAAFDFDQDGDLDIIVGGTVKPGEFPKVTQGYLFANNNDGTFTDVTATLLPAFSALGIVKEIVFDDLNGDGKTEMIVTGDWMPIMVFEVNATGFKDVSADFGFSNTDGWWNKITIGDFNGDGIKDIAAGNLGLNCRLKASEKEPIEVYATDIDNNGQIDPIYTYYEGGACYPLTHRNMLISQVPAMKKKFVRYEPYAKASIDDILSPELKKQAIHKKVYELGSCIFWGTASGKFTKERMPDEAQISTIQGLITMDINQDGIDDIMAVGNDYGLEIESGRLDAGDGWVLLGQKNGMVKWIPNRETGFWASLDARGIVSVPNKAGKQTVVVTNNNAGVAVYNLK